KADTDNPKGYLEWERIKQLPKRSQSDSGGRRQSCEGHLATDSVAARGPRVSHLIHAASATRGAEVAGRNVAASRQLGFERRHIPDRRGLSAPPDRSEQVARGQGERAGLARALSSCAARTEGGRQRNSRVLTGPARHRGHGSASGWKPVSQSHEVARRREDRPAIRMHCAASSGAG